MDRKYFWAGAIAAAVIILDQATKYLILAHVRMYEIITVIPGFFNITHVRNRGAAFGMLSGMPDLFRSFFFITVTVAAVVVIAVLVKKTHERLQIAAFSLIAGGAVGNVIDRLRFGEVVDFIDVYIWEKVSFLHPWPTFNIADSAITIGVALLIIDMLFGASAKKQIRSQ